MQHPFHQPHAVLLTWQPLCVVECMLSASWTGEGVHHREVSPSKTINWWECIRRKNSSLWPWTGSWRRFSRIVLNRLLQGEWVHGLMSLSSSPSACAAVVFRLTMPSNRFVGSEGGRRLTMANRTLSKENRNKNTTPECNLQKCSVPLLSDKHKKKKEEKKEKKK
ncbi:hypothetical protein BDF14DRAFT_1060810 [Spinellus fusiger]|nr:hypothetical protein BDF14DRAFT_1060810 [Spinellus fusiger]